MEDVFIGMIKAVAFDFVPYGWLPCNGQVVPVYQYQALYGVLGNRYGGTAPTTFGIPDLRGYTIIGAGPSTVAGREVPTVPLATATGVNAINLSASGNASLTIGTANLPPTPIGGALTLSGLTTTSTLSATTNGPGVTAPAQGAMLSASGTGGGAAAMYYVAPASTTPTLVDLNSASVQTTLESTGTFSSSALGTGAALPTILMSTVTPTPLTQPSLGLTYIICYEGVFPVHT